MTSSASPLWAFSLVVYGKDGVQGECLDLQERLGLDVNLLLLCAYVGAVNCVMLTAEDIAAARELIGPWHADVVKPLRAARRNLKTMATGDDEAAGAAARLRIEVKAAELESERIELMLLERWANDTVAARPPADARDAILANIKALLDICGGHEPPETVRHLIAAALGAGRRAVAPKH